MAKLPSRAEVKKEIEERRNHSLFDEIYTRHSMEPERITINYWGTEITYATFFQQSRLWAGAMHQYGIRKGDEIVACMDRTPELTYLLGASSILGVKLNLISSAFKAEYIQQILHNAQSKLFFVQDVRLVELFSVLDGYQNELRIIPIPHKRSLTAPNPYECYTAAYYTLDNAHYQQTIQALDCLLDLEEFLELAKLDDFIPEKISLDDALTVTYSSGTTNAAHPKGIVHRNRHYITMGRYHDPEVSGLPSMKALSTYFNIPAYSNSFLLSALTDNLIQGGIIILDPIDEPGYFLTGLQLHKSSMNCATTSTWLLNVSEYYRSHKPLILENALFNFAAGEELSAGEERFLNRFLRDTKAGTALSHTPLSIAKMCTAGADCEHGSLFIRLFRAYSNYSRECLKRHISAGMHPYEFVDVQVLRHDGTYAEPFEYGRLVANSDCTMQEYNHDPEATKDFYIQDAYGVTWGDMNVFGYVDLKGNVVMKGRISPNDTGIPCFCLADEIARNKKDVLSCEVVRLPGEPITYVAHLMLQPDSKKSPTDILQQAQSACINRFGPQIAKQLYFRIRAIEEGYPITKSAKRDRIALQAEGLQFVKPSI